MRGGQKERETGHTRGHLRGFCLEGRCGGEGLSSWGGEWGEVYFGPWVDDTHNARLGSTGCERSQTRQTDSAGGGVSECVNDRRVEECWREE